MDNPETKYTSSGKMCAHSELRVETFSEFIVEKMRSHRRLRAQTWNVRTIMLLISRRILSGALLLLVTQYDSDFFCRLPLTFISNFRIAFFPSNAASLVCIAIHGIQSICLCIQLQKLLDVIVITVSVHTSAPHNTQTRNRSKFCR